MSQSTIKAVLFDLGKVLLHFDFTPAFKRLSERCPKDPEGIRTFFMESGLEVLYDGGKISSLDFYREVRKGLDLRMDYQGFRRTWNRIFTPVPGMARLVGRLARRRRLVLVSNTNEMHYRYVVGRYPVLSHFHRHVLSFREKSRKPDAKIYHTAQRACGARPREIFYIDDREDLTSAARELGFRVHTFRNDLGRLNADLRKHGLA